MKPHSTFPTILTISFIIFPLVSLAAQQNKERRLALVIGNGDYKSAPLKNPTNDAQDMADVLRDLGFEVIERINANKRRMVAAIDDFYRKLRRADIGLFYFAGHGIQINGRNYLISVRAHVTSETDVEFEAVEAGRVLGKMKSAENRLNIVILDACRDNPFKRSFRSARSGLVQMYAPKGTIIAYATSPDSVALDGVGRNGIYTKHLLRYMKRSDLSVQEVLMETGLGVMSDTSDQQVPWVSSTPIPQFYFASGSANVDKPTGSPQRQTLTVESNIQGAKVFVDDRLRGQTPLENFLLSTGQHTVRVEMPGYESLQRRINVSAGRSISIYVDLNRKDSPTTPHQSFTNSIGMKFVLISAGSFMMGIKLSPDEVAEKYGVDANSYNFERPQHEVSIGEPFYLQTTEVTVGQWRKFIKETEYKTDAETGGGAWIWDGSELKKNGTMNEKKVTQKIAHDSRLLVWVVLNRSTNIFLP